MKAVLAGVIVAVLASPAYAMGVYVNFDIVAWNADGTSALVASDTTSSATAGSTHEYIVVSAGDATPVRARFSDMQDPDKASEKVDKAACLKAAASFDKLLAAKHFKGVSIKSDQCATAKRAVVAVSPDAAQIAALSWLSAPVKRTPSARETAGWAAAKAAGSTNDVAAFSDKLVLVFSGENGDGSPLAHVAAYAGGKVQVADLR